MVYVAALVGLILGAVCGYVLRREIVETTAGDSDRRLKELRQLHATCGDRLRTLSMQVGQLESQLAGYEADAADRPTYAVVAPAPPPSGVGQPAEEHPDDAEETAAIVDTDEHDELTDVAVDDPDVHIDLDAVESEPEPEGTPLTTIVGIGNISAVRLAAAGVTSLEELAILQPSDAKRLSAELGRLGQRMLREDWIGAARRELEERATAP